jgi:protein gp37
LGATVENQEEADRRITPLLAIDAAHHFLSCEPLLGPLDLRPWLVWLASSRRIDWVICGGESGAHARIMDPAWARSLRDQCRITGTAFFMKQMTWKGPIPDDLMVREFPK